MTTRLHALRSGFSALPLKPLPPSHSIQQIQLPISSMGQVTPRWRSSCKSWDAIRYVRNARRTKFNSESNINNIVEV